MIRASEISLAKLDFVFSTSFRKLCSSLQRINCRRATVFSINIILVTSFEVDNSTRAHTCRLVKVSFCFLAIFFKLFFIEPRCLQIEASRSVDGLACIRLHTLYSPLTAFVILACQEMTYVWANSMQSYDEL